MKLLRVGITLLAICFSIPSFSKELNKRLGVGGRVNPVLNIGEIISSYYVSPEMSLVGGLAVDTQENNSKFAFNAEMRRVVFKEDNMNFYMSGKLGLINSESSGVKNSGYELSALFGGEFFFQGLDSLGFTFQAGVGVISLGNTRFVTFGGAPTTAGIVFYF